MENNNFEKFRKPTRKICELCCKKRKSYVRLRFGKLWRICCRKCFKEYGSIADEYQFLR